MGTGKKPPFHSLYLHWVRGRIGEIRAQFNAMAWGPEDADYSTPESLGFDYAKFDCDPGLKREVEMMIEFRDIMDEKSALWQKSHKEWKAASGDWNKRWKDSWRNGTWRCESGTI